MKNSQNIKKNEIDILLSEIKKYYKLIIGILLISFILSAIYAILIHKPIYQATALVQIAKKNNTLIEPTDVLKIKLLDKFEIYTHNELSLPKISNVKVFKRGGGIIKLYALGKEKNTLTKYIEDTIKDVSLNHNKMIDEYIIDNNASYELVIYNLMITKKSLKKIKSNIKKEEKTLYNDELNQRIFNDSLIKLLRYDRQKEIEENRVKYYTNQIKKYKKILLPNRTFETYLLNEVKFDNKPINIGRKMIIVVGTISGLLFAILLILLLSFMRRESN